MRDGDGMRAMPQEEQLAILRQGMAVWNTWRETHHNQEIDLSGADLQKADLRGFNLSRARLDLVNLSGANLEKANLSACHLRRANLSHANLNHANLTNANLDRANLALAHLESAVLVFASLRGADLRGAYLKRASIEDANLTKANLTHAHLERAILAFSDCSNAEFVGALLKGANLAGANLDKASVSSVDFDRGILWTLVKETRLHPKTIWRRRFDFLLDSTMRCKGIHPACYGSQKFANFLKSQDFLEEMMETRKGRIVLLIWWIVADCGRSFVRWGFWSLMIILLFGFIYWRLGPENFRLATLPHNIGSMMYFSVVTFSTLGFGDVIPRTPVALFLTGLEVFCGYFMMGGLISIFATKLARLAR